MTFYKWTLFCHSCSSPPTRLNTNSILCFRTFDFLVTYCLSLLHPCLRNSVPCSSPSFREQLMFRICLLLVSSRFRVPMYHFIFYKYCQKSPLLFLCDNWSYKNILSFPMLRSWKCPSFCVQVFHTQQTVFRNKTY